MNNWCCAMMHSMFWIQIWPCWFNVIVCLNPNLARIHIVVLEQGKWPQLERRKTSLQSNKFTWLFDKRNVTDTQVIVQYSIPPVTAKVAPEDFITDDSELYRAEERILGAVSLHTFRQWF